MINKALLLFSVITLGCFRIYASDTIFEQEITDEIVNSRPSGEIIWLNAGEQQFLGLFDEAKTKAVQGAALILPGVGEHPQSKQLIVPLREQLAEFGWTSLTIQLPVLRVVDNPQDAYVLIGKARERIKTAIEFLKKKELENLVLIGHGFGARTAVDFQFAIKENDIRALVVIGLSVPEFDIDKPTLLEQLGQIEIPVLDIYGAAEHPRISASFDQRKKATRKNASFRQVEIDGADHQFNGNNDLLGKTIYGWIRNVAPGVEITK